MPRIITQPGDCCASLAKAHGLPDGAAIHQAAGNENFRGSNQNMHVLTANQNITIPAKKLKTAPLTLKQYNQFVVKGVVTEFILSLEEFSGVAIANKDYELTINGVKQTGKLDATGKLKVTIDAAARTGELVVYLDNARKNNLFWPLEFGALQQVVDIPGVQARLNNLGYVCDNENSTLDASTQSAIISFKMAHGLNDDYKIDAEFIEKLHQEYGF